MGDASALEIGCDVGEQESTPDWAGEGAWNPAVRNFGDCGRLFRMGNVGEDGMLAEWLVPVC